MALTIQYQAKPTQRICTDNQYGGRNCFNSVDNNHQQLRLAILDTNGFEGVCDIYLTAQGCPKPPEYQLRVSFSSERLDSKANVMGKIFVQALSAFVVPVNYNMQHTLHYELLYKGESIAQNTIIREGQELSSWYNAESYQQAAMTSMAKEMVMELNQALTVR